MKRRSKRSEQKEKIDKKYLTKDEENQQDQLCS
jgi:hypothetical protein